MGIAVIVLILVFALLLTACDVVGAVIKTGLYSGIFAVVAIIGLIIFIIARLSRKK